MLGSSPSSNLERVCTPSTTVSDFEPDENQWIKRPPLQQIYDPELASDPETLHQKLSDKELGTLHDYINLW